MSALADAEVRALLSDVARRAGDYLAGLDERPVAPDSAALAGLARFDEPLPTSAGDAAATLALLDEAGSPATVASAGGRYFGFVTGGSHPVALGANWLAAAWDQNTALPVMSPVAARLHEVVTRWLGELLGLPAGSAAVFVTGAAMANTAALTAARDQQLAQAGWDVQADGLFGAPELTVVVGEHAHSTLIRALGLVGLGRERVRRVPADDQGRMRPECLPADVTGPAVICAQAGEVNTGAFDPFPDIVAWARERGAWVHVDGAFGLWALADPGRSRLTAGLVGADSWATDAHKWLNVPYDCGIALVRRPEDLRRSFAAVAGYLPPGTGFEAMHHTPQSSQRARQVEVWAVLRTLGRAGVTDLIVRTCDHAQAMAADLRRAGLEVLNDVVLNQVLVRAATDELTLALVAAVQQDGTCWCGPTTWQHRPAMRISVSGWATSAGDVRKSAAAIIAAAGRGRLSEAGRAPVQDQRMRVDVARLAGQQPHRGVGHFPGRRLPAERQAPRRAGRVEPRRVPPERGVHQARHHEVSPDAPGHPLPRDLSADAEQGGLRRVIRRDPGRRPQARRRADEHDRRTGIQHWKRGRRHQEVRPGVDRERLVPLGDARPGHAPPEPDADVQHQAVDPAQRRRRLGDHRRASLR
jgi:glutamate/tyrosine decarboxylase-like PLP-dependent enzyme